MIGITDYQAGNLQNLQNALDYIEVESKIFKSPEGLEDVDKIILPGVGAFGHAAENLKKFGFWDPIIELVTQKDVPILGICVGMQLLFSESSEGGSHEGLGIIAGKVRRFESTDLKIPQMGWNRVSFANEDPIFDRIIDGSWFYFVHSYACRPDSNREEVGVSDYGDNFCSVARKGNVWGVQFHPEKSQNQGLQLLHNFSNIKELAAQYSS